MIDLKRCLILARRGVPAFGLSIACCCAAWAQPDGQSGPPPDGVPPPGEMQQHMRGPSVEVQLKQLTELLMLTPDQQTQVGALLTDEQQQIEALLKPPAPASSEDQPPSREAMEAARTAIKAIHDDTQSKIAAVLTDDQKTKFAVWEKQRAEAIERQENNDAPPPPPDGAGGPPGV